MRQCDKCGYLLPAAWDMCKKCGAPVAAAVPVPAMAATATAPAGRAAAPPSQYGAPTQTAAIGGGYDPRYAAPARLGFPTPGTPPSDARAWGPAVAPPARPTKSIAPFVIVVAALALGGGWFGLRSFSAPAPLPSEAEAYIDGGGVLYAPFNQGYSVRLPSRPTETTLPIADGIVLQEAAVEDPGNYEVRVGSMDMGMAVPAENIDAALHGGVQGLANERDGTEIKSETRIEYEGRPATDAVLEDAEGYEVRVLAIIDGSRVFVLLTHATVQNDTLFETLRDSLELTA